MDDARRSGTAHETWLAFLMQRYRADLLRIGYLYLRDAGLAEDAAQETFVKAYRAMDTFRGESSEKTWLMRIAVNTCKDMRRSAWFKYVDRRIKPESLPHASQPFSAQDEALTLAVMALPRKQMDAVILYYYQGMDLKEVADTLGVAVSTVSTRLRSARMKLETALKGDTAHA